MARFDKWADGTLSTEHDYLSEVREEERLRKQTMWEIQNYLVNAAIDSGLDALQAGERVDELFEAYGGSWFVYSAVGANQIVDDINTDATIGWLNVEYPTGGGKTIRERVVTQLEKTTDP